MGLAFFYAFKIQYIETNCSAMLGRISPFSKLIIAFYVIISIGDFYILSSSTHLRIYSKPLLMITLFIGFLSVLRTLQNTDKWVFAGALIFALLGDIFLVGDDSFILGLGSFLIMQLIYIYLFIKDRNFYGRREWMYGVLLLAIIAITNYFLMPHVGDMLVPVILYTTAISLMSFFAYTRDMTKAGYSLVWIGTLFFILSDTLLAINLFLVKMTFGGILVMLTYVIAQFLIASGYAKYLISKEG